MKIEMTRTLTIPRELEDAISFISEMFSDEDDFTAVCCAIAAWDYDMFAEACFAIACNKKNFEWGLTKIDIVYKED